MPLPIFIIEFVNENGRLPEPSEITVENRRRISLWCNNSENDHHLADTLLCEARRQVCDGNHRDIWHKVISRWPADAMQYAMNKGPDAFFSDALRALADNYPSGHMGLSWQEIRSKCLGLVMVVDASQVSDGQSDTGSDL